jgi:hypothetical protein
MKEALSVLFFYIANLTAMYGIEILSNPQVAWMYLLRWIFRLWIIFLVYHTINSTIGWFLYMKPKKERWADDSPSHKRRPDLKPVDGSKAPRLHRRATAARTFGRNGLELGDDREKCLDMSHVRLGYVDFMWAQIFINIPLHYNFLVGIVIVLLIRRLPS